jgi:hypothetical protein
MYIEKICVATDGSDLAVHVAQHVFGDQTAP